MKRALAVAIVALSAAPSMSAADPANTRLEARSKDGARIVAECAGSGPRLVIVHGGTGDRTRWTPLLPLFAPRFRVCAMDRRGFGDSGDGPVHSLRREAEDVVAMVEAEPGPAFVLGHSYGGVVALEAALLSDRIAKLVLYEPPVREYADPALIARMEDAIARGDRDAAMASFLREVIKLPDEEIAARKARPFWAKLAATIHLSPRQMRALNVYRLDEPRVRGLKTPTLLLKGSATAIPAIRPSMESLERLLPVHRVHVFEGEQHFAMDTRPKEVAQVVGDFLSGPAPAR